MLALLAVVGLAVLAAGIYGFRLVIIHNSAEARAKALAMLPKASASFASLFQSKPQITAHSSANGTPKRMA